MESENTGMEAKVVGLLGPDLLEAPGFGEFLDPECCVWVKQNNYIAQLVILLHIHEEFGDGWPRFFKPCKYTVY